MPEENMAVPAPQETMPDGNRGLPPDEVSGEAVQADNFGLPEPEPDGSEPYDVDEFGARIGAIEEYDKRTEEMIAEQKGKVDSQRDALARMFFQVLIQAGVDPSNQQSVGAYFAGLQEEDPDMAMLMEKIFNLISEGDDQAQVTDVEQPSLEQPAPEQALPADFVGQEVE